jgi:CRISPR system Cascade subunit CasA
LKENRYNLIDEDWIPVAGKGKVGLRTIFSDPSITSLGGNPVEKIAVFKLLLAIAQSAYTPEDEADWKQLGCGGMQQKVMDYLEKQYDCFWLYGEHPFLQMPEIEKARKLSFGSVKMEVATGNTSVVTEIQSEKKLSDDDKALTIILLMGFACGGKKTDNSIVLTQEYTGKSATGKSGPSLGFMGFLHSFFFFQNLAESIYRNLFTKQQIADMGMFPAGTGIAPWLQEPGGENDQVAKELRQSYMGRLIPLSRFVLLADDGIHYSEGIASLGYAEYVVDPSVSVDFSAKPKPKVLWVDPERKPWRQITSLLSFLDTEKNSGFNCFQLRNVTGRCGHESCFSIWSGGVRVSSNAGEQYLTGTDDFVESEVQLSSDIFGSESKFFGNLSVEMEQLESIAKNLYGCILRYYADLLSDGKQLAAQGTNTFWQLCEGVFQKLVNACESDSSGTEAKALRNVYRRYALQIYDEQCPNQTARQLEAWAKNRPFTKQKEEVGND